MKPDRILIEVLGTGTSVGVPGIGCECPVCTSTDLRDKRLRPSILLRYNGRNVLIDAGPDLRQQALRSKIDRLDAILFTHAHADHIMGLDDVRPFNFRQRQSIPIYGSRETISTIRQVFRYIFETLYTQSTLPKLESNVLETMEPCDRVGLTITPIPVKHGHGDCVGYKFGSAAYLTDHSSIPESSMELLEGLDVLFLDGLRHRDHPTHSTVSQSLLTISKLKPRRGYFTHISHELGHEETERSLPTNVSLAYDGLKIQTSAHPSARLVRGLNEIKSSTRRNWDPCVLTIGNFDGVHLGHEELLRRVKQYADENHLSAAAMTFDPHPAKLVAPGRAPRLLSSLDERRHLMAEQGIEQLLILPFDRKISQLSPSDFVKQVLVEGLNVRHIIVGEDFRFGHQQQGDTELLIRMGRTYGFTVEAIRKVDLHHHHISSTGIREHLREGRVSQAAHELGRPYTVTGDVVSGFGIGSKQTVPTLNISWTAEIIPARGVYVTRTREQHSIRTWDSVTNIGFRPTFSGESLTIETFLISPFAEPTPRSIEIEFLHRLRDEMKFPSPESLKTQILMDVKGAQTYFRRLRRWVEKEPVDTIKGQ